MAVSKHFTTTTSLLLFVMVFPAYSQGNVKFVTTTCGHQVSIFNDGHQSLGVRLNFSGVEPRPASCSWLIPAANNSMSNQVVLTGTGNLSCNHNPSVFSVAEIVPEQSSTNLLTVECMKGAVSYFQPMIGRPGLAMVVELTNTSLLPESLILMNILPFVWSDAVCPRGERKVVTVLPGTEDSIETFSPSSGHLLSRYPVNMVCQWEFRSLDEGVVNLVIKTAVYDSDSSQTCEDGRDHFLVRDGSSSSVVPVVVPLCENPGVLFKHTSLTGSVYVDLVSDDSGGAYQSFFLQYWSIESCPAAPLDLEVYVGESHLLKGSSFSSRGAGHEKQCLWHIHTLSRSVIRLDLEHHEFGDDCDNTRDYLLVDGRKIGFCNGRDFPVFSEKKTMEIVLHTKTEEKRQSLVLNYTAVYKNPCQGYPYRSTIYSTVYISDYVLMRPVLQGDISRGLVCQWIFTTKDPENTIRVAVDWAEANSRDGVPFDNETCSYPNFSVYAGETANASSIITPTCSEDKSAIVYTSPRRSLLFVYRRKADVFEPGFAMEANQIVDTSSGGRGSVVNKKNLLPGALALIACFVIVVLGETGLAKH